MAAEEVLLEEEDENAVEKSPLDGAWYKRKQNLPGERWRREPGSWFLVDFENQELKCSVPQPPV